MFYVPWRGFPGKAAAVEAARPDETALDGYI
jgi:hypothetical protein